ncbi:MAG: DNA gyrase subunit A, partial [Planctomycetota bacterium]
EAEFLPAKLPVTLLLGIDGIAVGMATKILPHNFCELLQAQIDLLENRTVELLPDFIQGGLMDASDYDAGRGRIRVRARIEPEGDKRVVIREVPYGTTTEGLIASMEVAAQKGTVKIGSINDYTTDRVEIEVQLARGVYADEVIPQLYAYTDCELSISSNITVIREGRPWETTVSDLLYESTLRLRKQIKAELEWELEQLEQKHHWLTLEQIFIENRVYKRIEEQTTQAGVTAAVYAGMEPFTHLFIRAMTDDDVNRLLEIRIRRISQYDIDKNRRDIDDIVRAITQVRGKLRRLTKTTIAYLSGLLEKYGPDHPRRTEITAFETVDIREVARAHHKVNYDKSSGFFGTQVRGNDASVNMSDFDKLLVICEDGTFRITGPIDKQLLPARAIHFALFDPEAGARFTVIYRDAQRIAYAKKVHILRFINNREYELIKGRAGKIAQLIPDDSDATLHCEFVKAKRQRVTSCDFDLGEVDFSGVSARGRRIAPKPVARIKVEK